MKKQHLSQLFTMLSAALMLFAFTTNVVAGEKSDKMSKTNSPNDIKAQKTDDNNVKLSWASVSDADQYKVYRAEVTEGELKKLHKGEMKSDQSSKMKEHGMYSSIDIDKIDQSKLNFREIGTTTNTEFVDRTVATALRSATGSQQYAMGETERGPAASEEGSTMNDIVFLYSIAAVDNSGNESKMSNLTKVDFDESSKSKKSKKEGY